MDRVKRSYFPESLSEGWGFIAEITDKTANVFLQLVVFEEEMKAMDESYAITILQLYRLIEVRRETM